MSARCKYPRTFHFPWSPGATSDDKVLDSVGHFVGRRVVVTEKLDGENTSIYADSYSHARSMDSAHHPSRAWIKAQVAPLMVGNLPEGWRVCGEGVYARHSIGYDRLPSYFLVFAIYDENNRCLSWDETVEWCALLGLEHVPVIYDGPWDEETIKAAWTGQSAFGDVGEGYVVRVADAFDYDAFADSVAKYVRPGHVQTGQHWMSQEITPNGLRG